MSIHALKPAVGRNSLVLIAGLVWTAVGILLSTMAGVWLAAAPGNEGPLLGTAGAALAVVAWRFGFSRLSLTNVERIERSDARACLFSFQAWKSCLVMGSMIALGMVLRHSAIPKPWLAVVYSTVGGALILASLDYYRHFIRLRRNS